MVRRESDGSSPSEGLKENPANSPYASSVLANAASSAGTKRVQQVYGRQSKPPLFVAIGSAARARYAEPDKGVRGGDLDVGTRSGYRRP
jgi:hypothetical protein